VGETLEATGDYAAAKSVYEEVLESRRHVLGPEHADTLTAQAYLAACLEEMGRYEEARVFYEKALEARRRVLGETSPKTKSTLNGLGGVLITLGEVDKARAFIKSALEIRLATLAQDDRSESASYRRWARLLDATGDCAGAREFFDKALAVRKAKLRPRHPHTTTSAWELFAVLERLDDPSAKPVFEEHLAWLTKVSPVGLHIKQRQIREKVLAHLCERHHLP